MTKKEMERNIKTHIRSEMRSISIDGSAFDSSQYASLMDAVDGKFWNKLEPHLTEILKILGIPDESALAKLIVKAA